MADVVLLRCNSCGAIYRPLQADGTSYTHVCPASVVVDAGANPKFVDQQTTPAEPARLTARRPIPNPRNENTVADVEKDRAANTTRVTDPDVIAAYLNTGQ